MLWAGSSGEILVQGEQERRQRKEQEGPEENEPVGEVEEPSAAVEEGLVVARGEEESEPVDEGEEIIEEELIQRRGCLRGCLTPIVAILAIVLIVVMIVHAKRNAISGWLRLRIIANTQNDVLSDLPEDMDVKKIETTFEKVRTALEEGTIDVEVLDEAIKEYQDAMRKRPPLEERKQEINRLMESLNAAIAVPVE